MLLQFGFHRLCLFSCRQAGRNCVESDAASPRFKMRHASASRGRSSYNLGLLLARSLHYRR